MSNQKHYFFRSGLRHPKACVYVQSPYAHIMALYGPGWKDPAMHFLSQKRAKWEVEQPKPNGF